MGTFIGRRASWIALCAIVSACAPEAPAVDAAATVDGGAPTDGGGAVDASDGGGAMGTLVEIVEPDAPSEAATFFGGAPDATLAPTLVYPDDGTVVPPNVAHLELHFVPGSATLFRMTAVVGTTELRIYFGCTEPVGGGCVHEPSASAWSALATAASGAGPITYSITGTDSAGHEGTSAPRTLEIAGEHVTGGLYYWDAVSGNILRHELDVPEGHPEIFLAGGTGTTCFGCHELSRDGTRVAVGIGIPGQRVRVYDVAARTQVFEGFRDGTGTAVTTPVFYGFSPDGTQLARSSVTGLDLADATTGTITRTDVTSDRATMPEWSPDGDHIVYVRSAGVGTIDASSVVGGSIARVDFDGTDWTVGPTLADADGGNDYEPTYSPDGSWIVYVRSPSGVPSMGDGAATTSCVADAELWRVRADGTAATARLDVASHCVSGPTFDPVIHHDQGHERYWLVFSSSRGFGLRYADGAATQLWMAAVDPTSAAFVAPAFRLPFQDITATYLRPEWVMAVVRATCTTSTDCGTGTCVSGRCFD